MTRRSDIFPGPDGKARLAYSCNCGWLDLGHLNPANSHDPHVGAANLWRQVKAGGEDAKAFICSDDYMRMPSPPDAAMGRAFYVALACRKDGLARFADGATGFRVTFKMGQGINIGPFRPRQNVERVYLLRHNMTLIQQKSVALAIFMGVSHEFEAMQLSQFQASGFSQEDLVSNLIGFYIAIGEITREEALAACHLVSPATSAAIWDRNGDVGTHKNRSFTPDLIGNTGRNDDVNRICADECANQPRAFPALFRSIKPAPKGRLFIDMPTHPAR